WLNPPWADEVGQRKLRQLQLARSLGLPGPETLITNDPARARDFVASHAPGGVVRKAFRNIAEAPRETSVVSEADLRLIDIVRFAPVIFQRFVPADLDLRGTYVDGEPVPAAIRSRPRSDPARARDCVASHAPGGVVRKAFRNIAEAPRETSVVSEADLRLIDIVRFAPVIFQRFVPADLDLRVTYVDGELFPAAIRSRPEYQTDYRLGVGHAQVLPYELPDDVAARLRRLMDALDLRFGGIDMRVTPEGEHVFLEVNPAGEYLFVTERTGQPVPQAIAAALERHDREWGA